MSQRDCEEPTPPEFQYECWVSTHEHYLDRDNYDVADTESEELLSASTLVSLYDMLARERTRETEPDSFHRYVKISFGEIRKITVHDTLDVVETELEQTPTWLLHQKRLKESAEKARQKREMETLRVQAIFESNEKKEYERLQKKFGGQ